MKRCNCAIGFEVKGNSRYAIPCEGDGTEYRGIVDKKTQQLLHEAYVCQTHADMHFVPRRWNSGLKIITNPRS